MSRTVTDGLERIVKAHVRRYGGVRPAARALGLDGAYLSRMLNGLKREPSDATLRKLRVVRVVRYQLTDEDLP